MKKQFFAVVALAVSALNVQAAVIQYSDAFSVSNTAYLNTANASAYVDTTKTTTAQLQGFDSSLGSLTGVEVSFTSTWNHTAQASAYDSYSESYYTSGSCSWWSCSPGYTTYYNDTWVSVSAGTDLGLTLVDPSGSSASVSQFLSSTCSVGSSSCSNTNNSGPYSFNGVLDISAINIQDFVKGAGDFIDFNFENFKSVNLACDNNDYGDYCQGWSWGDWSGSVAIAYTYDETKPLRPADIPEPAVLFLLGAGLVLMGVQQRRNSRG